MVDINYSYRYCATGSVQPEVHLSTPNTSTTSGKHYQWENATSAHPTSGHPTSGHPTSGHPTSSHTLRGGLAEHFSTVVTNQCLTYQWAAYQWFQALLHQKCATFQMLTNLQSRFTYIYHANFKKHPRPYLQSFSRGILYLLITPRNLLKWLR